jgi:hypothetical protein
VRTVTAYIKRTPEACWRVIVDPALLTHWVPGLRRAIVISLGPFNLPAEIHFEFSTSLTYTLVYTYDLAAREMRFEPRLGKRDGVRGYVRIDAFDEGTRLEYGLEIGDARSVADRELGDVEALVASFAKWMQAEPNT